MIANTGRNARDLTIRGVEKIKSCLLTDRLHTFTDVPFEGRIPGNAFLLITF